MLYENFHREEEILNNIKNLCRENFGNFLSFVTLLKYLMVVGEEDREHILYIWNVNVGIRP